MKKFCFAAAIVLGCAVMMSGCSGSTEKNRAAAKAQAKNDGAAGGGARIAFVDIDSLMAKYEYYKDCKAILESKAKSIQSQLSSKEVALQKSLADFQQKVQSGAITQAEAEKKQNSLLSQQQSLQSLQEELQASYLKEEGKYNDALHDSIDNFLAAYNKTAGYTMILARSNDNILLAQPECDITDEVIAGLNKRYKKEKK